MAQQVQLHRRSAAHVAATNDSEAAPSGCRPNTCRVEICGRPVRCTHGPTFPFRPVQKTNDLDYYYLGTLGSQVRYGVTSIPDGRIQKTRGLRPGSMILVKCVGSLLGTTNTCYAIVMTKAAGIHGGRPRTYRQGVVVSSSPTSFLLFAPPPLTLLKPVEKQNPQRRNAMMMPAEPTPPSR